MSKPPAIPLVDLSVQHADIGAEAEQAFARIAASGAFVLGPDVEQFEREFAEYCGVSHCVGVANGTDAVEFALRAVGVSPGEEVILPANTFVATAGAVMRAGATPVLVDCDPQYLLIDPAEVEKRITGRTRAIVAVHLYGQLAPVDQLADVAGRYGVHLVEDAAQSHGATRHGRPSGTWGRTAGTSFYPGKNLGAYGDAGAVLTDSAEAAAALRLLRNHGSTVKYQHPELGFNSRLDTVQAAVLRAKLRRLDAWNEQRRDAARRYEELLAGVPGVTLPATAPGNEHVWHLYVIQVDERDRVLAELNAAGIGAGIHYPVPLHLQGAYAHLEHVRGDFPAAEVAADRILSLPIFPGITEAQQQRVVDVLAASVRERA